MKLSEAILAGSKMIEHGRGYTGSVSQGRVTCGCATTMAAVAVGFKPKAAYSVISLCEVRNAVNNALDNVLDEYVQEREQSVGSWIVTMNDGHEQLSPDQIAARLAAKGL